MIFYGVSQFLSDELRAVKMCFPLYLYILGSFVFSAQVLVYFAAQMGDNYLAGIGLGSAVYGKTLAIFMLGFSSVFDIYGPQMCGKKKQKELGQLLVKILIQGFVGFLIFLIPYFVMIFCLDKIPVPTDMRNEEVNMIASDFMMKAWFLAYLHFVVECFLKFFINQKAFLVSYAIAFGNALANLMFCVIFITKFGMKTDGLILSLALSKVAMIGICVGTSVWRRKEWNMIGLVNKNTFKNWGEMFNLGMVSGFSLCLIFSGDLAKEFLSQVGGQVTVDVIVLSDRMVTIAWPAGVSIAYSAAIMIGNALGEGDADKVKYMMGLNLFNALLERACFIALHLPTRYWYFSLFTDDPVVLSRVMIASNVYLGLLVLANVIELLNRGVLIAMGKAVYVITVTSCCACFVGIPTMCVLAYTTDLRAVGLLLGLVAERVVEVAVFSIKTLTLDIPKEIEECKERLEKEQQQSDTDCTLVDNEKLPTYYGGEGLG